MQVVRAIGGKTLMYRKRNDGIRRIFEVDKILDWIFQRIGMKQTYESYVPRESSGNHER